VSSRHYGQQILSYLLTFILHLRRSPSKLTFPQEFFNNISSFSCFALSTYSVELLLTYYAEVHDSNPGLKFFSPSSESQDDSFKYVIAASFKILTDQPAAGKTVFNKQL
jgi:hypothetical protein